MTGIDIAVWRGTRSEFERLQAAVDTNCGCFGSVLRAPGDLCGAHQLLRDQRVLDHLMYVRRTRDRFVAAEWER